MEADSQTEEIQADCDIKIKMKENNGSFGVLLSYSARREVTVFQRRLQSLPVC